MLYCNWHSFNIRIYQADCDVTLLKYRWSLFAIIIDMYPLEKNEINQCDIANSVVVHVSSVTCHCRTDSSATGGSRTSRHALE